MKISAINHTNFRGLFTDKSSENSGNWKMEYQPYSWETKPYKIWHPVEFGMAEQNDLDIFSENLPNNEKILVEDPPRECYRTHTDGRESCKDIFGTEFYYQDFRTKKMRRTITELPAMDRESSLNVLNRKLEVFMKMKEDLMNEKKSSISSVAEEIEINTTKYNNNSNHIKSSAFSKLFSSETFFKSMDTAFGVVKDNAIKTHDAFQDYIRLNESMQGTKKLHEANAAEIKLLQKARESGNLIDISRRDVYDPNKPLWDCIQEMIRTKTLEVSQKLVALPHKSISMQEILAAVGNKIKTSDASAEIINYVDKLISSRM